MADKVKRISAKQRVKTAVVKVGGKSKFPIPDKTHAVAAISREGQAKPPLTSEQRHAVEAKAATYGVGPLAKKNKEKK